MRYIVSLSGGVSSAVAADRAIERYGADRVTLRFEDTLWEDEDLYRFLADLLYKRWRGVRFIRHIEGRNPLQVAEDKHIVPNALLAPCTHVLKIDPFEDWLWRVPKSVTVLLGLSWSEQHRIDRRRHWHRRNGKPCRPTGYQARIPGVYEDFPLLWKPLDYDPFVTVKGWGVRIPRLLRDWEQRPRNGAQAGRTILRDRRGGVTRPLSLADLERMDCESPQIGMFEDRGSCLCGT